MAFLKNFLNKPEVETLFPQQIKPTPDAINRSETAILPDVVANLLTENEKFIKHISEIITQRVLETLCEKYDFTPTDKYLEEVSNRKKYIRQLDNYLQERREINNTVENELQMFLQETSLNLAKSLDTFTMSVQNRIKQAENRHGIDSIKESLLCVSNTNSHSHK